MDDQLQFEIHKLFRNKNAQLWLWIAITALLLGAFLITTSEMREASLGQPEIIGSIDKLPTHLLEKIRSPKINTIAIDLTALGSATIVTLFLVVSSFLLILNKQYQTALHLVVAGIGSAVLTSLLKGFFERPRPTELIHLVDVQGYSYPSGHSLSSAAVYFTFAVILCNTYRTWRERAVVIALSLLLITLIALSRVYLGVHYVSDVLAGMLVGIGWASLLGAVRSFFELRRKT